MSNFRQSLVQTMGCAIEGHVQDHHLPGGVLCVHHCQTLVGADPLPSAPCGDQHPAGQHHRGRQSLRRRGTGLEEEDNALLSPQVLD